MVLQCVRHRRNATSNPRATPVEITATIMLVVTGAPIGQLNICFMVALSLELGSIFEGSLGVGLCWSFALLVAVVVAPHEDDGSS